MNQHEAIQKFIQDTIADGAPVASIYARQYLEGLHKTLDEWKKRFTKK